ncbi:MAG: hypothetical protein CL681_11340 [Blastopirellula sp.]|nr:hypothetical protein [Blastopirellula sp.]
MKIYGLDFTSAPTESSPPKTSDKLPMLASGELDGARLRITKFESLTGGKRAPFEKFDNFLNRENQTPWVCGVDFPLGMPLGAINYFNWCSPNEKQTWDAYINEVHRESANVEEFRHRIEQWSKRKRSGEATRVFLFRYTDRIGGFGGTSPSSPMKVHTQCNPPVGRMFFEGTKRLLQSTVSIPPVRPTTEPRVVLESYPRLVADKFIQGGKYKDAKKADDVTRIEATRERILTGLSEANCYGITVHFDQGADRKRCLDDGKGDYLDSVLCAVQAAWAFRQLEPDRRTYGIPEFSATCLKQQVALEGWIVDPLTRCSVREA